MTGWNVVVTPVIRLYDRCQGAERRRGALRHKAWTIKPVKGGAFSTQDGSQKKFYNAVREATIEAV